MVPVHHRTAHLKIKKYAFYMHDYGAPVGLRLALRDPDRISGIITQSGNAYLDGFGEKFWAPLFAYAKDPGPETEPCEDQDSPLCAVAPAAA
ncbi:hypothetical protein V6U89_09670 [Micromonospora sp. CPCC 206171]|uniref:alpha/beta fold hydrolase n=1 Tax=Micromonospora sp. CPCC 206171 TaxID=3122405 RepID=UPI002FF335D9